jgi:oligopeptide/dipeptide ABC transporter ATP-binding protein
MTPLLDVADLVVDFLTEDGVVHAVDGVSFSIEPGEIVGVVGESGSGKSVTAMSILGLIRQPPGNIRRGTLSFHGEDLRAMPPRRLREIRGGQIAMVFQDPMTTLNPVLSIGSQIVEAIRLHHRDSSRAAARARALELLELVGVPNPEARLRQYPHEFSGGMRQRAMIAMAIANDPELLIADEPTTALDVTIQAQVLDLLRTAQETTKAATILITHDLGVIAELADRVLVMYAGRIVEQASVRTLFAAPRHPYTAGLLASLPRLDDEEGPLRPIPGSPPNMLEPPPGCPFHPRCPLAADRCRTERPELTDLGNGQYSACHFHEKLAATADPVELFPAGESAS